jgi:hypothetical protein
MKRRPRRFWAPSLADCRNDHPAMALLGMAKPTRPASRRKKPEANPEGPYETLDGRGERPASRSEVTHFIDFIEHLQDEAERLLGLSGAQREMRIIAHLVRNHMAGRLVTMCSLASASGLSHSHDRGDVRSGSDRKAGANCDRALPSPLPIARISDALEQFRLSRGPAGAGCGAARLRRDLLRIPAQRL